MSLTESPRDVVFLSARDLARRYGCHLMTVWKWRAQGLLPPGILLAPRCRRWRSDELEAFERNLPRE